MQQADDPDNGPNKVLSNNVEVSVVSIGPCSTIQEIKANPYELNPRLYRHIKTKGIYRILHYGMMQVNSELDMAPMVVYQNVEDYMIWARPITEFNKRFEQVIEEE